MGAWNHLESRLRTLFKKEIRYAGRRASASPATGALAIHTLEQDQLLASAFNFKASIANPKSEIKNPPHLPSPISHLPKRKPKAVRKPKLQLKLKRKKK